MRVSVSPNLFKLLQIKEKFIQNAIKMYRLPELAAKNIVEHGDDLQYLFTSTSIPRIKDESSAEGQIVSKYTRLLYSFAKNG